jgi:hypothetical protein
MGRYIGLSTSGYETSIAEEDVLSRLATAQGWTNNQIAKKTQFKAKEDIVLRINGFEKTILLGDSINTDKEIKSFVTVTPDVEFYVSFDF